MPNFPRGALTSNRKKRNGQLPLNHLLTEGCELFRLNVWLIRWCCKRHGGFKSCDTVGGEAAAQLESCDGSDPGIRIGDLMFAKYKNWTGRYECKVVPGPQGGKWVVKWDDNDPDDILKEPPHN
jgi:hypothetical protein